MDERGKERRERREREEREKREREKEREKHTCVTTAATRCVRVFAPLSDWSESQHRPSYEYGLHSTAVVSLRGSLPARVTRDRVHVLV